MSEKCNTCAYKDGLWNDPLCPHKEYCNECIHSASHRKDHYTVQAKVSKTIHAKPHDRIDVFE